MRIPLLLLLLGALAAPAWAQQPTLPGAPQPTPAPESPGPVVPIGPGPTAGPAADPRAETIGQVYSVELRSGTSFLGTLRAVAAQDLTFDTKDLGTITVQRANVRQLTTLTSGQARRGYADLGNGNRLLFGPTARNLRRGEAYVQSAEVFLISGSYGVTDNFSIGAMFTFLPGAGSDNFVALLPKLSFPVSEKLRVGGGAVLGLANGSAFSIVYANGTYGSADDNLTLGLGYGYSNGSFSSTPVFQVGGAARVSRRVSLINETYFFRENDNYNNSNNFLGIAGLRIGSQRLSGSLGLLYNFYSETYYNYGPSGYGGTSSYSHFDALPYGEISYRFGRIK